MKTISILLFSFIAFSASAQKIRTQEEVLYKEQFAQSAVVGVLGKTLIAGGIITLVKSETDPETGRKTDLTEGIMLISLGGAVDIFSTILVVNGIVTANKDKKKNLSFGTNKNGIGVSLNF